MKAIIDKLKLSMLRSKKSWGEQPTVTIGASKEAIVKFSGPRELQGRSELILEGS